VPHARIALALALALAAGVAARPARGNGRFPAAQYVLVGPGAQSSTIVLRTTFGLMVSRDAGASFHWLCEEALQYAGQWDPPLALASDGTISAGLVDGLVQTRDDCLFDRNASAGATLIADLSNSADGSTIWALEGAPGVADRVLLSTDGGGTFAALGAGVTHVWPLTLDAAPSLPARLYATAFDDTTRAPLLFRSDDGGVTLRAQPVDFMGAADGYLAAVHPTRPDTLWIRANKGPNTLLLRSDDGGATLHLAATTMGPMLGFAVSDDGARVWIGGETDGVLRSDDGGQTFRTVANTRVSCMRYHAGALYLCADWLNEPYALYRWRDGADAPEGIFRLADALGPADCEAGTTEHDTCGTRWPTVRSSVTVRARDGGADAAGPDGAPDGPDAGADGAATDSRAALDVSNALDGAPGDAGPPRAGSCACDARSRRRGHARAAAWLTLLGAVALARRARRRSRIHPQG
jgi:hypothetical protein